MKKILLILCALACGTLAFAQKTYTDWLHVVAGNDDAGVQKSDVAVEWTDEENRVIDFVLKDFSISISMSGTLTEIPLGDVTMLGINVGDTENGVATISCTEDHEVTFTDQTWAAFVSDISVNMTGDISETKLHADMEIAVSIVIFGNYTVTATFGYDYGEYLIVNAENGNYFGGGLDYGTHATETDKPQFFTFIQESDGTYLINGHQAKSTSLGLDEAQTDYYIDAVNPHTWELVEADDGSGYYIGDDDGYLTGNGIYKAATTESQKANATVWKLVTMDEVLATMDGASISNPVDVTPLIPAPEPKYNSYKDSWTATGYNETAVPNNYCFGGDAGWNASTPLCESYHSSNGFDVRQAISSLPAGYYELTAQGFYRNDGGTVIPSMYITTGTNATDGGYIEKVNLPEHNTTSDDMNSAYEEFLEGLYPVSLPFIVDNADDEFTVGFESNVEADDAMWSIFGELSLFYLGTELPELTAVTGTMNVDIQTAMTVAIAAYEANKTSTNFIAAEQAINDAEESVEQYELMAAEIEEVVSELDEAGAAAWEASDTYAAYTACTLETADEVVSALIAAQKAQTTAGSDMTYALLNSGTWTGQTGTYGGGVEHYQDGSSGGACEAGKILYNTVEGLASGTYEVTFYAVANMAWNDYAYGKDIAQVFVNDVTEDIEVINQVSFEDLSAYSYTLIGTVGSDGVLEFGLQNIATGGNWYVAEAVSLTLVALAEEEDPYIYDITDQLANPSFELDDVDNLTVDGDRCDADEGGAWKVTSLTGWDLVAPAHQNSDYPISDLMSEKATKTDNDFGAPGTPSDETYMLYLRNAHAEQNSNHLDDASVMQALILPAGEYKLTVDSKCIATDANAGTVTLVAGEYSKALTIHTDSKVPEKWDTAVLEFSLDATTVVTLGVNIEFTDGGTNYPLSVLLDNFTLSATEDVKALDFDYNVTWALANPSFEVDNVVANLTVDGTRSQGETDGAWGVTSLTGWDLAAPTHSTASYAVSDIMSAEATGTDNDFGVPGTPSDGTYMLYLREGHTSYSGAGTSASVKQSVTLPAGIYKVAVDSKCVATATAAHSVNLVVDETSKSINIGSTSMPEDWTTTSLTFSLDAETEVSLGVEIAYASTDVSLSVLLDNFKLYSVEEITKSISWTMTEAGWGTMILPFAASVPEGLTLYAGDAITVNDTELELGTEASSIVANTPYLVSGTAGSYSFSGTPENTADTYTVGIITGTLVDLAIEKGAALATDGTNYVLQNHVDENGNEEDDGLAFYPITEESEGVTLDAYHCYLTIEGEDGEASPTKLSIVLPGAGEETGIMAVEGAEAETNGAIYDLSGRRVSKAVKGVYIQNGKKVLVK